MSNISGASTSSQKLSAANADDSSTGDGMMGDDIGWWDCSLCTYKNSNDKFKCEICDLRRGTSTRKPRCNADTIVAQVVKQQEQIRQQTKVKTPKSRPSAPNDPNVAATSNDSSFRAKSIRPKSSSNIKNRSARNDLEGSETDEDFFSETDWDPQPKPKKKKIRETKVKRKQDSKAGAKDHRSDKHRIDDDDSNDDNTDLDHNDDISSRFLDTSDSSPATSQISSSSANSPEPTNSLPVPSTKSSKNPFKITPIEVNGNLIKYSPPTSSGRTGLIIDKKRFSQHSVTVNDVTITFTEFATRQNNYVRKKKKKRGDVGTKAKSNNGNGKSRTPSAKDELKSISYNDSADAEHDDP